jgi:drug/metabolite transporter (DMT)-like permease
LNLIWGREALRRAARSGRIRVCALAASVQASGTPGRAHDPVAALVLVTVSMALMVGIAAMARAAARAGVDPLQVVFFRNFFCVVLMLPLLAWRGLSLVRTGQPRLYGMRVAVSFVSMLAFFQAVALLPLAEVTAIGFLSPLFGTLFAIVLLGEHVGPRRWTALAVGFLGAMIILRPSGSGAGFGQLAALVSAMCVGLIGPLVKRLTIADDADRIVFISNLVLTPLSLIPALFVWVWPAPHVWLQLLALGLFAVLGHMALVRGLAITDASLATTFEFSRLPFSVLIGYLAFGELIDGWTWAGALIIFAAAAFVTRREAQLARQRREATLVAAPTAPPQGVRPRSP